jgi:aspartyl-tRNA(Asn)/glutamyl-tRNA(Gln) amidotransferase subunit A
MTIAEAADALARGSLTARDLLEQTLAAVERHGARTNAFVQVDPEGARAAADASDRRRARGEARGPLDGMPISLKDIIDVAGLVTSAGSRVLSDRVAEADAPVVTRLRDAGAVLFGKTNLHEFALGTTSDDSAFGPIRHPADASRMAGGSSGGSAAAVATGMGLASIGTDTGGSVRIPAAACGVVGLKASRGEVPVEGVIPLSTTLDHVGPLTSCVEDAHLVWAILAGRAIEPLGAGPSSVRLRRLTGYFDGWVSPDVREPFDAAVERLRRAGVDLTSGEIDGVETTADAYLSLVLAEAAEWHAPWLDARRDRYSPVVAERIASGRAIPAVEYVAARRVRRRLRSAVDGALAAHDALVLPTLPIVAPPIGAAAVAAGPAPGVDVPVRTAMLRHTQLFNMTGHPAISLPVPVRGLPVGLQLVGHWRETSRLLAIAAVCEKIIGTTP